jgi:SlyX protein
MYPPNGTDVDARIAEIEAKLVFIEDLLEQLNRTVFRQQEKMDLLQQEMRVLYQQVKDASASDNADPGSEVPPHY